MEGKWGTRGGNGDFYFPPFPLIYPPCSPLLVPFLPISPPIPPIFPDGEWKWATATHCFITTDQLTLFCHTLEVYLDKSYIPLITLSQQPPAPPPTAAQRQAANRKLRKLQRAEELESELHDLRKQGYLLVLIDGSSDDEPGVGCIARYGIATEGGHRIDNHMPVHLRQTNNAAELYAALPALKIFPNEHIALCIDSAYVILGAQGATQRWKSRGWRGSSGRVACIELWEELLQDISQRNREILWVKVPSHVDIPSNEEADRLSNVGRMYHPKYPTHTTPARRSLLHRAPRKQKELNSKRMIMLHKHHLYLRCSISLFSPHCPPTRLRCHMECQARTGPTSDA